MKREKKKKKKIENFLLVIPIACRVFLILSTRAYLQSEYNDYSRCIITSHKVHAENVLTVCSRIENKRRPSNQTMKKTKKTKQKKNSSFGFENYLFGLNYEPTNRMKKK